MVRSRCHLAYVNIHQSRISLLESGAYHRYFTPRQSFTRRPNRNVRWKSGWTKRQRIRRWLACTCTYAFGMKWIRKTVRYLFISANEWGISIVMIGDHAKRWYNQTGCMVFRVKHERNNNSWRVRQRLRTRLLLLYTWRRIRGRMRSAGSGYGRRPRRRRCAAGPGEIIWRTSHK